MSTLLWLIFWLGGLIALAFVRAQLITTTIAIGAGLLVTTLFSELHWFWLVLFWVAFAGTAFLLNNPVYRRRYIINPAFEGMKNTLPNMSETERVALEAGTVGWDAELFAGSPQWEKLLTMPAPKLSEEEQSFMENQVGWHGKAPSEEECERFIKAVEEAQ